MGRKSFEELSARRKDVLRIAVQDYILTGEAIASERLVKKYRISVSPATIRNDLAWLEEKGFMVRPHHSAGRVPTDEGYRFYVNSLGDKAVLTPQEEQAIKRFFSMVTREINNIFQRAAMLLADLTCCLGISILTSESSVIVKHFDLIQFGPRSLLSVIIFEDGNILRDTFEISISVEPQDVKVVEEKISSMIIGMTMDEIVKVKIDKNEELAWGKKVFIVASETLKELKRMCHEKSVRDVYLHGAPRLMDYPEMMTSERMLDLIKLFDEHTIFFRLASEALINRCMIVKIGEDNPPAVRDFSFVVAPYEIKGTVGAVGVLGPRRMDYAKAIAAVRDVSHHLTWRLRDLYES